MSSLSAELERGSAAEAGHLLARLRATPSGDMSMAADLCEQMLVRRPAVPAAVADEATRRLLDAAHAGHPRAAYLIGLLTALDTSADGRWTFALAYALAYLARAAKAGYRPAGAELALLAGDPATAAALAAGEEFSHENWKTLHDAIDPQDWTAPPPARSVSTAPFIQVVENFLSPHICDWLVERARPSLAPALIYDQADGQGRNVVQRTNSEMHFQFPDIDMVTLFLRRRIAALAGHAAQGMEMTAVLNYQVGQEFRLHHDFLDPAVPAFAREVAKTGQRLTTVLIYLNDNFEGGETDFPLIDYRFKGRKGDAILFRNVRPDGSPDFDTLHAGLAPTWGEKWLLSQWIRELQGAVPKAAPPPTVDTV